MKTKKIRNTRARSKIEGWKGKTLPEAYTRCAQEIAAARIANLPAAVSNNWLPRQVHIPPIMCITAPCVAMPGFGWTGYRERYASPAPRRYIYLRLASLKDPSMSAWSMPRLDTLSSRSLSRFKSWYSPYTTRNFSRYINEQETISLKVNSIYNRPTRLFLMKFLLSSYMYRYIYSRNLFFSSQMC